MDHDNIKVTFIISSNCESEEHTSHEMQQAFAACKQNNIISNWCSENDCNIDSSSQKTDFIVFQEFCGELFEKIKETKSVILGPWCLLTCLTEGKQIPNFPWPIYSVAMAGCTIAFSSLTKKEKQELQDKVVLMGGYVSPSLTGLCTHIVTNSVKSEKYIKGAEAGMKIMLNSWIDDVWECSLKENIHCNNKRFNKHVCPVFYNLVICCTGLSNTQRHDLCQHISENGGIYKEQLHVNRTDILVTESRTSSAKYKAAVKHNIKCVTMAWVTDSVKNGYAMPDNLYRIQISTSTPTKDGVELPNFSMVSNITNASIARNELCETIDGTQLLKVATPAKPSSNLKRKSNSNEHNELVDEINLKDVKRAGSFLDGCGIYLVGFGAEQREKLCKIINFSGATRYNDISERVTHIIAGDISCPEFKNLRLKNCNFSYPIVSVHWLLKSMEQESPAEEDKFIVSRDTDGHIEPSSPLTKKSLHLLHASVSASENQEQPESLNTADIVQQYFQPDSSSQEDTLARLLQDNTKFKTGTDTHLNEDEPTLTTKENGNVDANRVTHSTIKPQPAPADNDASLSSAVDDSSQPPDSIFQDLKFIIVGFTPEERKQIKTAVEAMAGAVVSKTYKGVCDYAVVPSFGSVLKHVATNIVNDLWITECWQENEIRPIEYFHQPISVKDDVKPLKNCVVTISTYTNYERNFLKTLIMQLGGVCQESLSRINSKSGLLACTHLISPEPTGKKYTAAVKWGLRVINKDWLLECARSSEYVSETPFLVGDVKASSNTRESSKSVSSPPSKLCDDISTLKLNKLSMVKSHTVSAEKEEQKPSTSANQSADEPKDNTPKNKQWNISGITASQITPVQKIITEARSRNLLDTPVQNLPHPLPWDQVDTPETPLGAFIRPNPSPHLRKEMLKFLNTFPEYKPRRDSTPLSELKRRLWDNICPPKNGNIPAQPNFDGSDEERSAEEVFTPPNKKSEDWYIMPSNPDDLNAENHFSAQVTFATSTIGLTFSMGMKGITSSQLGYGAVVALRLVVI
ncbi:DNA topoisomerase 2-binding protein 1-like isoform X2 [Photinus pyralis]|uniref:DNA topoisomerase 2-binding protein 1-like isoform X2 n=1 Tax=Photinus pyralis TaxID=7054 RepID=UPI0012673D3C|nr:DNA topoisomerase 2-binding protein 1-like isoform X2 [Photinus pyralis]